MMYSKAHLLLAICLSPLLGFAQPYFFKELDEAKAAESRAMLEQAEVVVWVKTLKEKDSRVFYHEPSEQELGSTKRIIKHVFKGEGLKVGTVEFVTWYSGYNHTWALVLDEDYLLLCRRVPVSAYSEEERDIDNPHSLSLVSEFQGEGRSGVGFPRDPINVFSLAPSASPGGRRPMKLETEQVYAWGLANLGFKTNLQYQLFLSSVPGLELPPSYEAHIRHYFGFEERADLHHSVGQLRRAPVVVEAEVLEILPTGATIAITHVFKGQRTKAGRVALLFDPERLGEVGLAVGRRYLFLASELPEEEGGLRLRLSDTGDRAWKSLLRLESEAQPYAQGLKGLSFKTPSELYLFFEYAGGMALHDEAQERLRRLSLRAESYRASGHKY